MIYKCFLVCKVKRFLKETTIKCRKLSENVCKSVVRHEGCKDLDYTSFFILKT